MYGPLAPSSRVPCCAADRSPERSWRRSCRPVDCPAQVSPQASGAESCQAAGRDPARVSCAAGHRPSGREIVYREKRRRPRRTVHRGPARRRAISLAVRRDWRSCHRSTAAPAPARDSNRRAHPAPNMSGRRCGQSCNSATGTRRACHPVPPTKRRARSSLTFSRPAA